MTLYGIIIGGAVTVIGSILTYVAAIGKSKGDNLDRAVSWWEKAVTRLEARAQDLEERVESLEKSNQNLADENRRFRHAIREVIRWLTANLEHEKAGKGPPLPYPFEKLLGRLLEVIDEKGTNL